MITAQHEIGDGLQEIVEVDRDRGVLRVMARPITEPPVKPKDKPKVWTFQAPKTLEDGTLMAYRVEQGQQFNLASGSNELAVFDGPGGAPRILPRPVVKDGLMTTTWVQHGHATPTDHRTLIHAVVERDMWWIWPIPLRQQWACVETDLQGVLTGYKVLNRAEPSWSEHGLTCIDPTGTGRIVTPRRIFDKASAPIGSKSVGWFDPHLSPDGKKVVWLDVVTWLPVTSGLIIGDVATGDMRYLIKPTTEMQTDAMWESSEGLVGARFKEGHWKVVLVGVADGGTAVVPNTQDCTAVHKRL